MRKQGASPCLQLLGPVISETRAAPISQRPAAVTVTTDTPPAGVPQEPSGTAQPAVGAQPQPTIHTLQTEPAPLPDDNGPVPDNGPPPGDIPGDEVIVTTAEHPAAEAEMAADAAVPAAAVAGPAMPPGWAPEAASIVDELDAVTEEGALSGVAAVEAAVRDDRGMNTAEGQSAAPPAAGQRPVAGPARPPDELLAAAAEVHQAVRCPHTVLEP